MDQRDIFSQQMQKRRAPVSLRGQQFLFFISLVVLILVLLSWAAVYAYSGSLLGENVDLRTQISLMQEEMDPNLVRELLSLADKLASARVLLQDHIISSNVFEFLEKNTHPKVAYGSISYESSSRNIGLAATAASFSVLARQISIFEASPYVEDVDFGGLTIDPKTRMVKFSLTIAVKPELTRIR
ncbi:MAG: hypothetical protein A2934_03350 [Candidatus Sungbacteria bacterium RIFCSPLOWO2_01_FULL_47_10]|uniref:Uncharacterized protein n=1 Tax=Candidatus Sungbacteria bacterium RIFCSPLOWO2_01_FULL_47_10 TaxID=1802276 RepID=A0A1G2L8U8_9BACT|nr:MAG: hypothetical protein A2934_03350 [Candidatus Sungbacteria bacterium RIFCSPLOWO2_01_FULL_47_10]